MTDVPDEVTDIALRQQLRLGRPPRWYANLLVGRHVGHVPGELTDAERARIQDNERMASLRGQFTQPIPRSQP